MQLAKEACLSRTSNSHKSHRTKVGSQCTACLPKGAITQVMFDNIYNECDIVLFAATGASTFTLATLCPGTAPQLQR